MVNQESIYQEGNVSETRATMNLGINSKIPILLADALLIYTCLLSIAKVCITGKDCLVSTFKREQ